MPIYEEKLISPFAIHFTQEHIRTTFRDGRDVEETRAEVTAQPAEDPEHFDLVLRVPFPCIEIMRWRTPRRPNHRSAYANDMVETHWYTLDNRRLYCLQAVAAAHWPQRVGAVVEILYADPGTIRRKYDSTTFGRSVTLAHSIKYEPITRWDWRKTVMSKNADPDMATRALEAVTADDKKRAVKELNDADNNNDQLRRLEEAAVAADGKPALPDAAIRRVAKAAPVLAGSRHSVRSTAAPASAEISAEEEDFVVCPRRALGGPWQGGPGELYRVLAPEGTSRWICTLEGGPRPPKFLLLYDAEEHVVWWGKERSYFVDAREVGRECSEVRWYARGDESRYPQFVWKRPDDTAASKCGTADAAALAERAIADIAEQLRKPGSNGRVSLPNWSQQYGKTLGTLRHFVQSRPDKFIVSSGTRFRMALAGESATVAPTTPPSECNAESSPLGALSSSAAASTFVSAGNSPSGMAWPANAAWNLRVQHAQQIQQWSVLRELLMAQEMATLRQQEIASLRQQGWNNATAGWEAAALKAMRRQQAGDPSA